VSRERSDAVVRREIAGKRPALIIVIIAVVVIVVATMELILLLRGGVPRSPPVSRDSRAAVPRFAFTDLEETRVRTRHFPYGFLISLFLEANERGRTRGYRSPGNDVRVARARGTPSRTIFENAPFRARARARVIHRLFILPLKVVTARPVRSFAGKARPPHPDSLLL